MRYEAGLESFEHSHSSMRMSNGRVREGEEGRTVSPLMPHRERRATKADMGGKASAAQTGKAQSGDPVINVNSN